MCVHNVVDEAVPHRIRGNRNSDQMFLKIMQLRLGCLFPPRPSVERATLDPIVHVCFVTITTNTKRENLMGVDSRSFGSLRPTTSVFYHNARPHDTLTSLQRIQRSVALDEDRIQCALRMAPTLTQ